MEQALAPGSALLAYRTIESVTARMVSAASDGRWEAFAHLSTESLAILNRLRKSDTYQSLDAKQRLERLSILKKIVENDAQIRKITEPWSGQLSNLMAQPNPVEQKPERERAHLEPYRVHSQLEAQAVLRQLLDKRIALTMSLDRDPKRFVISQLVALDDAHSQLFFDRAFNDGRADHLAAAGAVTVVGFIDHIKVQFGLAALRATQRDGEAVFESDGPTVLYRLQRRNAYRVRPLESHPSHCLVPIPGRTGQFEEVKVLDISVGGLLVEVPASLHGVTRNQALSGCFLHLPGHTAFRCDFAIRHVHEAIDARGMRRLGLDFIRLGSQDERTVQVYVNALDIAWRRLRPACS